MSDLDEILEPGDDELDEDESTDELPDGLDPLDLVTAHLAGVPFN